MESPPEPPPGSTSPVGSTARSVADQAAKEAAAGATETRAKSDKAVAAMVLGILGLVSLLCSWLILALPSLILGILAIVFGQIARNEIKANPGMEGDGQATAGFVTGIVATSISTLILILMVIGAIASD